MNHEIDHPASSPKQAALQLVIELVRAGKLSSLHGDASNMISIYQQFKAHFEADKQKDSAISDQPASSRRAAARRCRFIPRLAVA